VGPCGGEQERKGGGEKKGLAGGGIKVCLFGNQQTMRSVQIVLQLQLWIVIVLYGVSGDNTKLKPSCPTTTNTNAKSLSI